MSTVREIRAAGSNRHSTKAQHIELLLKSAYDSQLEWLMLSLRPRLFRKDVYTGTEHMYMYSVHTYVKDTGYRAKRMLVFVLYTEG